MTPCAICRLVESEPPPAAAMRRVPALVRPPVPLCVACASLTPHERPHLGQKVAALVDGEPAVGWFQHDLGQGRAGVLVTNCPGRPACELRLVEVGVWRCAAVRAGDKKP